MALVGDDQSKLKVLCERTYAKQSIWFLNAYFARIEKEKDGPELFWKYVSKCVELDEKKKADGHELDEFQAHRFLEFFHEPHTVVQLREKNQNDWHQQVYLHSVDSLLHHEVQCGLA